MFSSVSCFRILPYLLNLNLQYDLHVFLPMQKKTCLSMDNVERKTAMVHLYVFNSIQRKI